MSDPMRASMWSARIRAAAPAARALARIARMRSDRGGSVLLLFALALVPMIGMGGLGIEFLRGINYRARLDAAADAAAIVAITTARDYISANAGTQTDPTDNAVAAGKTRALATFRINAASALNSVPVVPTVVLKRTGQVVDATVTYATTFATPFRKILGQPQVSIAGSAGSSLTLGRYIDFYLLLDTSGSMGFPTSTAQQLAFAKINPDMKDGNGNNCAFACHFSGYQGYPLSKSNNIELRIKTVGNAVTQLLSTAKSTQTLTNQYRVGLFPFVSYMETAASLTSSLDSLQTIATNLENYMDYGDSSLPRGSGGTHYENILTSMNAQILTIGDGSNASTPQKFVFLVTDGIGNNQYWNNKTGWTGSQAKLLDATLCAPLKKRGIIISILYIPYIPLATPFNTNVGYENIVVNNLIPSVPKTLTDCASSGYFRTASTSDEITAAMNAMFAQATSVARLTQ